jgi:phage gpG-like protein
MKRNRELSQLDDDLKKNLEQFKQAYERKLPEAIGHNLVDGFRDSFQMQRFNDYGSKPWKEVKRRKPGSGWYGFEYKGERKANVIGLRSKRGANFSRAATTRGILIGHGRIGLSDSIFLQTARAGRVVVSTNAEHAKIHNEGGTIKVFGKGTATMPKRQIMGHSDKINQENKTIIDKQLNKILK